MSSIMAVLVHLISGASSKLIEENWACISAGGLMILTSAEVLGPWSSLPSLIWLLPPPFLLDFVAWMRMIFCLLCGSALLFMSWFGSNLINSSGSEKIWKLMLHKVMNINFPE